MLMEARVHSGAHYLSDTVFAAFIDWMVIVTIGGLFYGTKNINKVFATYNANSKSLQFVLVPLLTIIPTVAMIIAIRWFI